MSFVENLTHAVDPIFAFLVICLNIISISLLVWGVILATVAYFKGQKHKTSAKDEMKTNNEIKIFLGSYILLSLEVLIAADIIESIIHPTVEDLLKLGMIVVIRTAISYFLHLEIVEEEKKNT